MYWSGRQDLNLRPPGPEPVPGGAPEEARRVTASLPEDAAARRAPLHPLNPSDAKLCEGVHVPSVSPHSRAPLLTVAEVAELLRVSRATVYKLCEIGELPHVRISNSIRVPDAAIRRFVAK